jgi:hypothetical protein
MGKILFLVKLNLLFVPFWVVELTNGGKFAAGVVDTAGAPGLGNISANFRKHLKCP